MKFYISEKTASVFWKDGEEIVGAPIWADGTFTTTESASIDDLEDKQELAHITIILNEK